MEESEIILSLEGGETFDVSEVLLAPSFLRYRWHVVAVYIPYEVDQVLHLLTPEKPSLEEVLTAVKLHDMPEPTYIGWEPIPPNLPVPYGYLAFTWGEEEREIRTNILEDLLAPLTEYRKRRVTIDVDSSLPELRLRQYPKLPIKLEEVWKTQRGQHLVFSSPRPLSFRERIKLRRFLGDDPDRTRYDQILSDEGYEALTGTLFVEKWWKSLPYPARWKRVDHVEMRIDATKSTYTGEVFKKVKEGGGKVSTGFNTVDIFTAEISIDLFNKLFYDPEAGI